MHVRVCAPVHELWFRGYYINLLHILHLYTFTCIGVCMCVHAHARGGGGVGNGNRVGGSNPNQKRKCRRSLNQNGRWGLWEEYKPKEEAREQPKPKEERAQTKRGLEPFLGSDHLPKRMR